MCTPPKKIFYYYGQYQPLFDKMKSFVTFIKGLPDINKLGKDVEGALLIIDDLMAEIGSETLALFTKHSHHLHISVAFLTQNYHFKSKFNRSITLNADILVLFRSPRDRKSIYYISQEMYPRDSSFLVQSFLDATRDPYTYIFLNLQQETPDILRIQSDIFKPHVTIYTKADENFKEWELRI